METLAIGYQPISWGFPAIFWGEGYGGDSMKGFVDVFEDILAEPDPPHGLLLNGVHKSGSWLKQLPPDECSIVMDHVRAKLGVPGPDRRKELYIMVLQGVGGTDSLKVLDKLISDGEPAHGAHLIAAARHAKAFVQAALP